MIFSVQQSGSLKRSSFFHLRDYLTFRNGYALFIGVSKDFAQPMKNAKLLLNQGIWRFLLSRLIHFNYIGICSFL